jgi:hypothetical protein
VLTLAASERCGGGFLAALAADQSQVIWLTVPL